MNALPAVPQPAARLDAAMIGLVWNEERRAFAAHRLAGPAAGRRAHR